MIKAVAPHPEKGSVIFLGLSQKNLDELKADNPIIFKLQDLNIEGLEGSVVIFAGKNELELKQKLLKGCRAPRVEMGSVCESCGSGRREDGSCDCQDSTQ
jgi:hypothetical protein